MELMPIIKASLGIFTIISSTIFITAFVMYKIKSRNRAKPYERKPIVFDSSLILEVHDKTEEKIDHKLTNNKFLVLNEYKNLVPKKKDTEAKDIASFKSLQSSIQQNNNPGQNSSGKSQNEVSNIYNLYSEDSYIQMHKLKFNTIILK
jgi:hypothetical protein